MRMLVNLPYHQTPRGKQAFAGVRAGREVVLDGAVDLRIGPHGLLEIQYLLTRNGSRLQPGQRREAWRDSDVQRDRPLTLMAMVAAVADTHMASVAASVSPTISEQM